MKTTKVTVTELQKYIREAVRVKLKEAFGVKGDPTLGTFADKSAPKAAPGGTFGDAKKKKAVEEAIRQTVLETIKEYYAGSSGGGEESGMEEGPKTDAQRAQMRTAQRASLKADNKAMAGRAQMGMGGSGEWDAPPPPVESLDLTPWGVKLGTKPGRGMLKAIQKELMSVSLARGISDEEEDLLDNITNILNHGPSVTEEGMDSMKPTNPDQDPKNFQNLPPQKMEEAKKNKNLAPPFTSNKGKKTEEVAKKPAAKPAKK